LTTIEENPFEKTGYRERLQALEHSNKNLWRVYYKGEWGQLEGSIFTNYTTVVNVPEPDFVIYGLDFGFNNPSSLIKVSDKDNNIHLEEKIYRTQLTNTELIKELKKVIDNPNNEIYCDSSEPDRIKEIRQAGFNAKPADKDVGNGIDFVQGIRLNIQEDSINLLQEIESYSWKEDKDGNKLDEPVKFQDHLMDALRYALYTHYKKRFIFKAVGPDGMIQRRH